MAHEAEIEADIRDYYSDQMRLCKGLRYLLDHGYVEHRPYLVGAGAATRVVHTVLFPPRPRGAADAFHLNYCPICGSKFTPSDGECPPLPNCAEAPKAR